jgi:transcription antitermination factor NusG
VWWVRFAVSAALLFRFGGFVEMNTQEKNQEKPQGRLLQIGDRVEAAVRPTFAGVEALWRLVQVGPLAEGKVAEALGGYGVETYLPLETLSRAAHGRRIAYQRPLVRGYLFARLPAAAEPLLHEIAGGPRLVSIAGTAAVVPPGFVYALIAAERAGLYDSTRKAKAKPLADRRRVGERVLVTTGPYAGFAATVMKLKPRRRVEVMIALCDRQVRKEIDLGKLEAAE